MLVPLGTASLEVAGATCRTDLSARLYDFGVCALQLRVLAPSPLSWEQYTAFGSTLDVKIDLTDGFEKQLHHLLARLAAAIEQAAIAPVTEDYVLFRVQALCDERGERVSPALLTDEHLVPLLIGEQRRLSDSARRDLLAHRFSYYGEDLTILTWDNALLIEPDETDGDIEYLLEFANAQLLELRVYDAQLDAELPAMYDRIQAARPRWGGALFSARLRRCWRTFRRALARSRRSSSGWRTRSSSPMTSFSPAFTRRRWRFFAGRRGAAPSSASSASSATRT